MFGSLLLQIAVILITARVCGWLLRLVGQPSVIGEMIAGILLGPTVLGHVASGSAMHALFPENTRAPLQMLSQLGVVLFMFLVGLEFDLERVGRQGAVVLRAAIFSMMAPFIGGLLLAFWLLNAGYGPGDGGTRAGFVMFVATALSITAFPVLARILNASSLRQTNLASMALACAAINDLIGWCLLAAVMASQQVNAADGITAHTLAMMLKVTLFIAAMLAVVRPLMRRMGHRFDARGKLSADAIAMVFILLVVSAWVTESIGIHALFGAFVAGAVMPSGPKFVAYLMGKVEDLVTLFLVPLYFGYTGLHTELGLLDTSKAWMLAGLVTLLATLGKVGGTFLATHRPLGPRQALTLGVLMNTRGLMELIILNMALELKAIDASVYAMMVVMTLVTTACTAPLVNRMARAHELLTSGSITRA